MPPQRPIIAPPASYTQTIIRDVDGTPILEIGYSDYMVANPDGSLTQQKVAENIMLADGTVWNPSMMQSTAPVLLGCCHDCRHPPLRGFCRDVPTHGLVTLKRARHCKDCGRLACPRHITKVPGTNAWRCLSCAKKYRRRSFIRSIFFTYEDD